MRALSIGATGMLAQQLNVEVISNNIANMTTTGFKRQRAEFQDLLYQNVMRPGSTSSDAGTVVPSGIQLGTGVKAAAVYRINEQGNLQVTGNKLDLALQGNGFFQVELPNGETAYTRAGSFQLNAEGTIVTAEGYTIVPGMNIPQNAMDITINNSGEVLVKIPGQVAPQNIGQFQIAVFANPAGLESVGDNMLMETPASGAPVVGAPLTAGFASILQGSLETSNVNVVSEITNLITAQRAYEMNSKVIRTTDEMLNAMTQLR
jgi:flagellar basal-body rod protein FlgG